MTAPEKIYVCIPTRLQRDDPKYVGIAWSDKAYLTTPQIEEYIRKDALMEWENGEIMPGNSAEGKGWNWALQTLIEKIETL